MFIVSAQQGGRHANRRSFDHVRPWAEDDLHPLAQEQYEPIVDNPEQFRRLLDQQIQATPELFPPEIRRGYRMKDIYASRKTTWKLRRIELRNGACYLVRPSFLMPYLTGRTEDVQGPLFFASSPSLSGL